MKSLFVALLFFISFFTQSLSAQQLSGIDIMKENDKQFNFKTEESTMTMELINSSGKKRVRSVKRYSKRDANKNTSVLIRFLSPADVKGSAYLSIEHSANDESRHLYLPALKKARRISAGEDSDNFMGSDFTYEDLDNIDFDKYSFKLLGSESFNSIDCHKVEVTPIGENKKTSGYSKRIYFIDKKTYVIHKIDFYDRHNSLFKHLILTDFKLVSSPGIYRAYNWTMENLKTKHKTTLTYQDFKVNEGLDESLFSTRSLERSN
jgi:Protein of unknown function (DUF1329).